jgi:hypothetical protein
MTQPDPRLAANVCRQCGQSQINGGVQAPMVHYGADTYHLDCLPYDLEALHRDRHSAAIDAAKSGVRGDELRAVVHSEAAATLAAEATRLTSSDESAPDHVVSAVHADADTHTALAASLGGAE